MMGRDTPPGENATMSSGRGVGGNAGSPGPADADWGRLARDDQFITRLDILFGSLLLRPEWVVKVADIP